MGGGPATVGCCRRDFSAGRSGVASLPEAGARHGHVRGCLRAEKRAARQASGALSIVQAEKVRCCAIAAQRAALRRRCCGRMGRGGALINRGLEQRQNFVSEQPHPNSWSSAAPKPFVMSALRSSCWTRQHIKLPKWHRSGQMAGFHSPASSLAGQRRLKTTLQTKPQPSLRNPRPLLNPRQLARVLPPLSPLSRPCSTDSWNRAAMASDRDVLPDT